VLSDRRFACGRVLAVGSGTTYGSRSRFLAGLLDWVGAEPPAVESIAGALLLEAGYAHIATIAYDGGEVLGERSLESDGLAPPASVRAHWGRDYPALRAERRFVAGDPAPRWGRRRVSSPLTDEMLRPAASGEGVVRFSRLLSESELRRLADWLAAYPRMTLRVYGSSEIAISGSFASSRRCGASNAMRSTSSRQRQVCITCLPSSSCSRLARQGVSSTSRSIARFRDLKELYLERQMRKIEAAGGCRTVRT